MIYLGNKTRGYLAISNQKWESQRYQLLFVLV